MNEQIYNKLTAPFYSHPHGLRLIRGLNKLCTGIIYLTYPIVLLILALTRETRFWRVLLTPAITFILVSFCRHYINAPRPYELLAITPIIAKDTKGQSFPSRHVFSAFVIATILYHISHLLGVMLLIFGTLLALMRVIGGVHFPKDVIAGALLGIFFGFLGFLI